ncbi:TPA: UPF0489 family protein [Morganella morganii]|uniref:UPF0489 family protein n=1 Tax=Morganella morganii TaxID=582 RepID=UPI000B409537|nr:UPF0489 family protein [Morganella morganii]EKW7746688.1 UPF0489 family protein [Morganella morganii]MBT0313834.1 UPF0489 family protein [Morganella morganii subsp. morganii]MBT0464161.1 UPF0489 family protein [Morganella morganii subsp. morganii]MBT0468706.1 UPF0489 family protein [Morganella morganii subsp. morganii]MBT0478804.1 UPF0489 family protein [Morganella morganii subsp. morganii]
MNWLIPLNGKSPSGAYKVNFLVQDDKIYISDNHRVALWCWMQHLTQDCNIALFHIDRHYDTLPLTSNYIDEFPGVFNLQSLTDYLNLKININSQTTPLIRWDNYLSFFISDSTINSCIQCIYLATHKDGTFPKNPLVHNIKQVEPYELLADLEGTLSNHDRTIINIDLDYFFTDKSGNFFQFIDSKFIIELFKLIKSGLDNNEIECLTICLSPECCGSWYNSEKILEIAKKELDINFTL